MAPQKGKILAEAMELPADERLSIASELLDSVEGPEDEEWGAAWVAEIDRRAAEADRGEVELEDWDVVKSRIREELRTR